MTSENKTEASSGARIGSGRLGKDGPIVGVQGFGAMGISEFYGETDEAAARETLDTALDVGVTLFDTADIYGAGANEQFLAPFVAAHRDEITLATKFGISRKPEDPRYRGINNDPAYIRQAVEASLRRLGTDVIDLYYMHRHDPSVPFEDSVGAMAELVTAGKVRYLGLSEVTGAELRAAHAVHPITALQSEWSLFSRDIERSAAPTAAELGIALVPYSPLGRGFLTGSFQQASDLSEDDIRRIQPRYNGDNARRNVDLLEPIREVAKAHDATLGQIALAWVHHRSEVYGMPVVPIPGTRKAARVRENTAATRILLGAAELESLDAIGAQVAGDRYPDMNFTSVNRE